MFFCCGFIFSGVHCEELTQPASMTVQPGQPLTISCKVSYSVGSYYTAWIRQPAGKTLEWIGMKYTGGTHHKDSLKNKFSLTVDSSSNTVTLTGQNLQTEDTAVYYCARLHSDTNHHQTYTKTHSTFKQ
uniref:Ig-like domain-containing protein n=1 Tax=Oncorhynchus kisutch TaxID=8019 RepID=A0A8C7K828_ONCKI